MSVFDWCTHDRHADCHRQGTVYRGKELVTLYCQCDERSCKCSKNPRKEGVQATDAVV